MSAPGPDHVPSRDELDKAAMPAHMRRAPRLGRFVGSGVMVGIVVGFILGFALPNNTGVGRFLVGALLALSFALLLGLLTAGIAVIADSVSVRRQRQAKGDA